MRPARWKVGDSVRLALPYDTHLGRMAADTPGVIVQLKGSRAKIDVEAGEIWIDADRLIRAQRTLEEASEL